MKYVVFSMGLLFLTFGFSTFFNEEYTFLFADAGKGEAFLTIVAWAIGLGCILIAFSGIMHYIDKLSKKPQSSEHVST